MKLITENFFTFNSVYVLIFYIVMNSLYEINQAKASIAVGNDGSSNSNMAVSNNGKCQ